MVVEQCCSRACARSALSVPAASHRCFALGWHVRQIPCFLQAMLLHRLFSLPLEETIMLAKSSSICCPRAPNHVEQLTLLHCSLQGLLRKLLPWVLPPPLFRGAFSNTSQCVAPTLSFTLSLLSGRRAELTSSTSCLCTGHLLPSLVLSPRLLTLLFHTSRL